MAIPEMFAQFLGHSLDHNNLVRGDLLGPIRLAFVDLIVLLLAAKNPERKQANPSESQFEYQMDVADMTGFVGHLATTRTRRRASMINEQTLL